MKRLYCSGLWTTHQKNTLERTGRCVLWQTLLPKVYLPFFFCLELRKQQENMIREEIRHHADSEASHLDIWVCEPNLSPSLYTKHRVPIRTSKLLSPSFYQSVPGLGFRISASCMLMSEKITNFVIYHYLSQGTNCMQGTVSRKLDCQRCLCPNPWNLWICYCLRHSSIARKRHHDQGNL